MKKQARVAHRCFINDEILRKIPILTERDAQAYIKALWDTRPNLRHPFLIQVIFEKHLTYGARGQWYDSARVIKLSESGQNLATLLHEIAHATVGFLRKQDGNRYRVIHGPEFYAACKSIEEDVLEVWCDA